MSDVTKLVKKKPCPPLKEVARAEKSERAEGVEKALKMGRGDVVAGARRLGMEQSRPKIKPVLKKAEKKGKK